MAEDKRTIVILIRVKKQGFVMFPLFFCFMDPVYETPPKNCVYNCNVEFHMCRT